ncbi:MAG: phasin family protein [Steroidobacteraceae bacterium]
MATRKKSRRARALPKSQQLRVVDFGNQIWLAGLGALARTQKQGPKLFQSLVKEGRTVQSHTREATADAVTNAIDELRDTINSRSEAVRDKTTEAWDNVEKIFQSRVHKVLQQLGVPTAREISSLSRKVDELSRGVHELTRTRAAERRVATRRPRARSSAEQPAEMI